MSMRVVTSWDYIAKIKETKMYLMELEMNFIVHSSYNLFFEQKYVLIWKFELIEIYCLQEQLTKIFLVQKIHDEQIDLVFNTFPWKKRQPIRISIEKFILFICIETRQTHAQLSSNQNRCHIIPYSLRKKWFPFFWNIMQSQFIKLD